MRPSPITSFSETAKASSHLSTCAWTWSGLLGLGLSFSVDASAQAQGLVVPARVLREEAAAAGAMDRSTLQSSLEALQGARLLYGSASALGCCVPEPSAPGDPRYPSEPERVGYGQASLIVTSPWVTMRYLGESPAGLGASPEALSDEIRNAVGQPHDILPVTTTVHTINLMMDRYFVPLLKTLPQGAKVLQGIHVQGAYLSPTMAWGDERERVYDNAFVMGLQSLLVYPSSCFHRSNPEVCRDPFLSAGHDPTVVGHELAHVLFNHLVGQEALKGFQWFAVNEGYADFFSAAFFETAAIGQSWQGARMRAPYLRRLSDHPTVRDPEALRSAHAFGNVWGSLLWSLRQAVAARASDSTTRSQAVFEFDRAVVLSMAHLGEGGGARLGDAARALIKAIYELGHLEWDPIVRSELRAREITLTTENLALVASSPQPASRGFGCSGRTQTTSQSSFPVHEAGVDFWVTVLLGIMAWGLGSCVPVAQNKSATPLRRQLALDPPFARYACDLGLLSGTSLAAPRQPVALALLAKEPDGTVSRTGTGDVRRIIVYDPESERAETAVQVLFDASSFRIDRALRMDGQPIRVTLSSDQIRMEPALQMAYVNLVTMVFESAPLAAKSAQDRVQASGVSSAEAPAEVSFALGGQSNFRAVYDPPLPGVAPQLSTAPTAPSVATAPTAATKGLSPAAFPPLPREIRLENGLVCERL